MILSCRQPVELRIAADPEIAVQISGDRIPPIVGEPLRGPNLHTSPGLVYPAQAVAAAIPDLPGRIYMHAVQVGGSRSRAVFRLGTGNQRELDRTRFFARNAFDQPGLGDDVQIA